MTIEDILSFTISSHTMWFDHFDDLICNQTYQITNLFLFKFF